MKKFLVNSRFYVLVLSLCISLAYFIYAYCVIPSGSLQDIRFEQLTGLTSIGYLYLSLLIGPLYFQFPQLPYGAMLKHSRRAIGVSAFYFASLHSGVTFFRQLSGFSGLAFLSTSYLIALAAGFICFVILFLLTLTSLDYAVKKMTFSYWKALHRLVYMAGLLILVHILMLGTHFTDLTSVLSQMTFLAVGFLLFLNALRFDVFIEKKLSASYRVGITTILTVTALAVLFFVFINPIYSSTNGAVSFGIHAAHIQLARDAQSQTQQSSSPIPGLDGDRLQRYTVSVLKPETIFPNQDTEIQFLVFNASTGNPVIAYKQLYTKVAHLIIVDSTLTTFMHLHPTQDNNGFRVTTQFPSNGTYHAYLDFQPFGGIEQQIGSSFTVGETDTSPSQSVQVVDTQRTKTVGAYTVTLDTHGALHAQALSLGQQTISFTLRDRKTNNPVTSLQPYLGAFGHLVIIGQKDYTYLHVHPANLTQPKESERGGPTVDFLPIGIYGAFTPGIYRVFVQFNPDGTLITTDFTVNIEP